MCLQDGWNPELSVSTASKEYQEHLDRLKNNARAEAPDCHCHLADKLPPEPGSYYTHLGSARTLPELRSQIEHRSGFKDKAVRIEKVLYTGKEGKTTQGCPLAKWVIRRGSSDEKILVIVKHRQVILECCLTVDLNIWNDFFFQLLCAFLSHTFRVTSALQLG